MHAGFDGGAYRDMVALARHTAWLNGAANRWSDYGLLLFAVLAAAGIRRSGWRALWVPGAMVAAFAFSALTKLAFAEQRPCRTLPDVGHIVAVCPPPGDYAFPSNHAVLAGAAAVAVWMLDRRLGVVAAVNAVVIAAARVYIGVHYPHDVVAGLLFGALVASAGTWAGGRLGPPALRRVPPALRERAVGLLGPLPALSRAGGGDDGVGEDAVARRGAVVVLGEHAVDGLPGMGRHVPRQEDQDARGDRVEHRAEPGHGGAQPPDRQA